MGTEMGNLRKEDAVVESLNLIKVSPNVLAHRHNEELEVQHDKVEYLYPKHQPPHPPRCIGAARD